jgi:glutaconyl-CoA/methylmalonyl-CoA decarboxylase subunit gamma
MRKFVITVNKEQFEVEVEEVKSAKSNGSVSAPSYSEIPSQPPAASSKVITTISSANTISAPMPGNIFKVNVNAGDDVKKGQTLVILEAMKMENEIVAPADGKVLSVKVNKGDCVSLGQVLVELA